MKNDFLQDGKSFFRSIRQIGIIFRFMRHICFHRITDMQILP